MSGDYEGLEAEKDNTDNQTASKINGKLDANSNSSNQSGATAGKTNNNLSLSANALRSQGVATRRYRFRFQGRGCFKRSK